MKKTIYFSFLLFIISIVTFSQLDAQQFGIPPEIKKLMHKKELKFKDSTYYYYVVYPKDFDSTKKYPVFIGLAGGMAHDIIVQVCYIACYRTTYLDNYIKILPIAQPSRSLEGLKPDEIKALINDVQRKEPVKHDNWLVSGISSGGNAAFNFAKAQPNIFSGIIVMPGKLNFDTIPGEWKNYKVALAIGEYDNDDWKADVEKTAKKLAGKVKELLRFTIKDSGNIIRAPYKMEEMYKEYFGGQ